MQRFAVDSDFRGKGIGLAMLNSVATYVQANYPELLLVALVQVTASKVYEKVGWIYVDELNIIYEQNMAHKMMILLPKTKVEVENLAIMKSIDQDQSQLNGEVMKHFEELSRWSKTLE